MNAAFPYVVLGLGGIGSAAAYWLSRRAGAQVLGLEQFEIGHVRGGSQDHSRIIRLSYHTPHYVELAWHAYAAWADLEADAGESLILKTGGLDLSPANARIPISAYTDSLTAAGIPFEWLDARETMARFPQWRLPDDVMAVYQAESGIAPAARCLAAHLKMARAHGATLRDQVHIQAIEPVGDRLRLTLEDGVIECEHLVVAAGAWTNQVLAHFGRKLPLTITQEQVVYYDAPQSADFAPERFPVWIWMDEPSYYGFPVYGEPGPKAAQDAGGRVVTPETRTFAPDPANKARLDAFVQTYLPGAYGPPLLIKTCLYTMPPDRDFVLCSLPEQPNVSLAVGAGHAFKFSSLLGKILSELALDGRTPHDIAPFHIDRPILLEANPPTNFMV